MSPLASAAKVTKAPPASVTPPAEVLARLYPFSVEQHQKMAEVGILGPGDRVELLEGWCVKKMTILPPHAHSLRKLIELVPPILPAGWVWQSQNPATLVGSEPEPDFMVMLGPNDRYRTVHPGPRDIALVVEVADSSLAIDRGTKARIYAAARIPVYWIINLADRRVEVFTLPRAGKSPTYRREQPFGPDDAIPVTIAGAEVGTIAVNSLLP